MTHVPYKGGGPGDDGFTGGCVQMMFDNMALSAAADQGRQAEGVCRNHAEAAPGARPADDGRGRREGLTFTGGCVCARRNVAGSRQTAVSRDRQGSAPDLREKWLASGAEPAASTPEEFLDLHRQGTAEICPHREGKRRPGSIPVGGAGPAYWDTEVRGVAPAQR